MTSGLREYLESHTCYDVLPMSFKQVVLDLDLGLKKALLAMLQNNVSFAPVWDYTKDSIDSFVTATEFIELILAFVSRGVPLEESVSKIDRSSLRDLPELLESSSDAFIRRQESLKTFGINENDSVLKAAEMLMATRIPAVPVMSDEGDDILSSLDRIRIVKFISVNCSFNEVQETVESSKIGTFTNLFTCSPQTQVLVVLRYFADGPFSGIPVLDEDGGIMDICKKPDFMELLPTGVYVNLEMPVSDMLQMRSQPNTFIPTCLPSTPLLSIMETVRNSATPISRFYVVESAASRKLLGIVSTADLLAYFLRPTTTPE